MVKTNRWLLLVNGEQIRSATLRSKHINPRGKSNRCAVEKKGGLGDLSYGIEISKVVDT